MDKSARQKRDSLILCRVCIVAECTALTKRNHRRFESYTRYQILCPFGESANALVCKTSIIRGGTGRGLQISYGVMIHMGEKVGCDPTLETADRVRSSNDTPILMSASSIWLGRQPFKLQNRVRSPVWPPIFNCSGILIRNCQMSTGITWSMRKA